MTGSQPSAHLVCALCDSFVQAPSGVMEQIEDLHVMFSHAITIEVRERIAKYVAGQDNGASPDMLVDVARVPIAEGDLRCR